MNQDGGDHDFRVNEAYLRADKSKRFYQLEFYFKRTANKRELTNYQKIENGVWCIDAFQTKAFAEYVRMFAFISHTTDTVEIILE